MAGVITSSEPSCTAPIHRAQPTAVRQAGDSAATRRSGRGPRGRPWSVPLEDRALLVAAYWHTNLPVRQLAPLCGVSRSAADRIFDHLPPMLALQARKRFAQDNVLIVAGTLVPTRGSGCARSPARKPPSATH
ncbi:hypothetical protein GCM10017562_72860 [Streptomyces roseofulvus]